MIRRIVFGLIYFVVFYIAILILTGVYTGLTVSNRDRVLNMQSNPGADAAITSRPYRVAAAALLAGIGTFAGVLPGTRRSAATQELAGR